VTQRHATYPLPEIKGPPVCTRRQRSSASIHPGTLTLSHERDCAALALGDVTEREPEPLTLDAHDDQVEPGPRVRPAMEQPQLRSARRELEEAEGGAQEKPPAIVRHRRSAHEPQQRR
jgi:hypothetical protein